jgi:hypothetical protein
MMAKRMMTNLAASLVLPVGVSIAVAAFAAEPSEGPAVDTSTMAPNAATPTQRAEESAPSTAADRSAPVTRRASNAADRLELDTSVVTGNRELPKVLYIVPWKKADLGDLPAQPFNTLLDEVLTPVDRDVFRREVTYFEAVNESTDATQSTSQPRQ